MSKEIESLFIKSTIKRFIGDSGMEFRNSIITITLILNVLNVVFNPSAIINRAIGTFESAVDFGNAQEDVNVNQMDQMK